MPRTDKQPPTRGKGKSTGTRAMQAADITPGTPGDGFSSQGPSKDTPSTCCYKCGDAMCKYFPLGRSLAKAELLLCYTPRRRQHMFQVKVLLRQSTSSCALLAQDRICLVRAGGSTHSTLCFILPLGKSFNQLVPPAVDDGALELTCCTAFPHSSTIASRAFNSRAMHFPINPEVWRQARCFQMKTPLLPRSRESLDGSLYRNVPIISTHGTHRQ